MNMDWGCEEKRLTKELEEGRDIIEGADGTQSKLNMDQNHKKK